MGNRSDIQKTIDEIVDRIVEVADPLRIVVFGSAAGGEMDSDSDIDVLVVMPDGVHRRRTSQRLYRALAGLGVAKDIVVVTESDVENYGENPSLVIRPALEHGEEVYHARR